MSNLLKELQKLKAKLPETEFYVSEWDCSIILRGFSLREARALRKPEGETDVEDRSTLRMLAHAIVDGDDRPLANDAGMDLLDMLSAKTLGEMSLIVGKLNGVGEDVEKNLEARADASSSSTDSPSRSDVRSLN